jgi:hypothetical protein
VTNLAVEPMKNDFRKCPNHRASALSPKAPVYFDTKLFLKIAVNWYKYMTKIGSWVFTIQTTDGDVKKLRWEANLEVEVNLVIICHTKL